MEHKLYQFQVDIIKRMLERKNWEKENTILEKFNVFAIEDIPLDKYDEVIDLI